MNSSALVPMFAVDWSTGGTFAGVVVIEIGIWLLVDAVRKILRAQSQERNRTRSATGSHKKQGYSK